MLVSSLHPSICWPFPAWSVVRVSVYLPWRPADAYCDGIEYSSYQSGLHQCWISHSGLAGCPPAAYSNIVSRIVIIGAELRPCSPRAAEDSQIYKKKNPKKQKSFFFPFGYKRIRFSSAERRDGADGVRGAPASTQQAEKGGWRDDGERKPSKAKIRHESVP